MATIRGSSSETYLKRHFFKKIQTFTNLDTCFQALDQGKVKATIYDEPILQRRLHLAESNTYAMLTLKFAPSSMLLLLQRAILPSPIKFQRLFLK
ncbi:MAG: hypothetical protein Sapg2KO_52280 [Saprospiraceae bacterium]